MADARIAVVWNPSKIERDNLERALGEVVKDPNSVTVTWHSTEPDDPGIAATREAIAAGAQTVLAAGGDGTVRAVLEVLASEPGDVTLGIIPAGTGNLLARNLDIPIGDLRAAMSRALHGASDFIDVGWVEFPEGFTEASDRLPPTHIEGKVAFAVIAGFGIDAHMITETDSDLKDRVGWIAYIESMGRAIQASEVLELRIAFDGGGVKRFDAHTLLLGNCGMLQGGFQLLPDATPKDGKLDALVMEADTIGGWLDTMKNLVWDSGVKRFFGAKHTLKGSKSLSHRTLQRAEITLSEPRVFEVDGDELGSTSAFTVEVQTRAVRVRGA